MKIQKEEAPEGESSKKKKFQEERAPRVGSLQEDEVSRWISSKKK